MNRHKEDFITLVSGRKLHIYDPTPEEFDLEDIAVGLANECRWGSQLKTFYSVAQHSILVGQCAQGLALERGYTEENARYVGLLGHLHDAAEGLGFKDMPTPIKRHLPAYEAAEANLLLMVLKKYAPKGFGGPFFTTTAVHAAPAFYYLAPHLDFFVGKADAVVLATEWRDLRPEQAALPGWQPQYEPLPTVIVPLSPDEARRAWLKRYDELAA